MQCPLGFIDSEDADENIKPGLWRECLPNNQLLFSELPSVRGSRYRQDAVDMLDALKDYLNSECGEVSWQLDYIRRT